MNNKRKMKKKKQPENCFPKLKKESNCKCRVGLAPPGVFETNVSTGSYILLPPYGGI
jgi:hypothetical protein